MLFGRLQPIALLVLCLQKWSMTDGQDILYMATRASQQYPIITDGKERKEGNVLFNNALNTFYLQLYGVTHMGVGKNVIEVETPE